MPRWSLSLPLLLLLLLVPLFLPAEGSAPTLHPEGSGEPDQDLDPGFWAGSGRSWLLHGFPADAPLVWESPKKLVNCSRSFWLPPSSQVCWENVAGPEEFAKSRLLVLQNRAALQAVSWSSGVQEGGSSYDHQAREEVQGVKSDHQSAMETMQSVEDVLVSLQETRRDGAQQKQLSSLKRRLANAGAAIEGGEEAAGVLERSSASLEEELLHMQLRLRKLAAQ